MNECLWCCEKDQINSLGKPFALSEKIWRQTGKVIRQLQRDREREREPPKEGKKKNFFFFFSLLQTMLVERESKNSWRLKERERGEREKGSWGNESLRERQWGQ